ncbi:MAG: endonuclease/exonuclease/phosphatase family protein, partial [Planctomycetota bacterium]
MRLVAWNILHGGGTRRTPEIALRLAELEPDLVVLTEFRRTTGGQIAGVLHDQGLKSQLSTNPDAGRNGVLIASRVAIEPLAPAPAEAFRNRWLDVSIPDLGVSLTGVHAPDARRSDAERMQRQAHFWQHLVRLGQARRAARHLVAGDLNTGRNRLDERGETLTGGWFLGRLSTLGYRDAFRLVKPSEPGATWTSHTGSGYRIDGVWVSRSLRESVRDVWHHDEAR